MDGLYCVFMIGLWLTFSAKMTGVYFFDPTVTDETTPDPSSLDDDASVLVTITNPTLYRLTEFFRTRSDYILFRPVYFVTNVATGPPHA